jgi:hypothetical protein
MYCIQKKNGVINAIHLYKDVYSYLRLNFPNPIPYSLFFYGGSRIISDIADKWLGDILSGESFYKKNRSYFTKVETKQFLSCNWYKYDLKRFDGDELLKYYIDVKIKANELDFSLDFFMHRFGTSFLNSRSLAIT